MKNERLRHYRRGLRAERLAALYLRCKGYRIVARRFKSPVGEIDLIACRGRILAFVEVKLREGHDEAAFSITPLMKERITRAAMFYLTGHPNPLKVEPRFDVITVQPPFSLRHIDNAWRLDA